MSKRHTGLTLAKITDCFGYLDDLRASGITNMFGARPYLAEARNPDPTTAGKVLSAWMKADRNEPAATRAKKALAALKESP